MNDEWFGRPGSRRRIATFGLFVAAVGGVSGGIAGFTLARHPGPAAPAPVASLAAASATASPTEPSVEATQYPDEPTDGPSAQATWTDDSSTGQSGEENPFAGYSTDVQEGFFMDKTGYCYGAYGQTPAEMAANLQAKVGKRVSGYDWFKDGIIVNFRNGARIPLWSKEIDCKDQRYDPLVAKKE